MSKEKKFTKAPPKCRECKKVLKWPEWTGSPSKPVEEDGSEHFCSKDEKESAKFEREAKPIRQDLEEDFLDQDLETDLKEQPKDLTERTDLRPAKSGEIVKDKNPNTAKMRITKIAVSRTTSVNYGVAKEYAVEKESTLDSFTLGMEIDTDANWTQAENMTKDLIKLINYITKVEFKEKTLLRLLK